MNPEFIPYSIVCPLASCSRSNQCARYAGYLKAQASAQTFEVMNPRLMQVSGDACPYRLVSEKQRWARGFKRLYQSVPKGNSRYLYRSSPYGERRFYKAMNGEELIDPEMQQQLLVFFRRNGADMSLGFDGYEEKVVLVEA